MTILKIYPILFIEHLFGIVYHERGLKILSENNMELIRMIRENDNPGQALNTAIVIVLDYLKQLESSEEQVAADLQALG